MKFINTDIEDIIIIEPTIHNDIRGYFSETFRLDLLEKKLGYSLNFVQENQSKSTFGVLRGLHYQLPPSAQSKLVSVIDGSVLDVAVDIRKNSPTFAQYVAIELSEKNRRQLFIPRGFAHGFVVLSKSATFSYKVDNYYSPANERGIAYDDKEIAINWELEKDSLIVSEKDETLPSLNNLNELFDYSEKMYE